VLVDPELARVARQLLPDPPAIRWRQEAVATAVAVASELDGSAVESDASSRTVGGMHRVGQVAGWATRRALVVCGAAMVGFVAIGMFVSASTRPLPVLDDALRSVPPSTAADQSPERHPTTAPSPALPAVDLVWPRVRGATYYNLQVFRGQAKIFEAWPAVARVRLPSSWSYHGQSHRLLPGRYVWFVWPGFGERSEVRYGKLLHKKELTLRRTSARG
jgi:hypothetical protein